MRTIYVSGTGVAVTDGASPQIARIGQLTDSTGGTPGSTLSAMTGVYATDFGALNSDLASLAAKVNAIESWIHNFGGTK